MKYGFDMLDDMTDSSTSLYRRLSMVSGNHLEDLLSATSLVIPNLSEQLHWQFSAGSTNAQARHVIMLNAATHTSAEEALQRAADELDIRHLIEITLKGR